MDFNIIGIVGSLASGKGVVTDYLIKITATHRFPFLSIVHEELKKRGITVFNTNNVTRYR